MKNTGWVSLAFAGGWLLILLAILVVGWTPVWTALQLPSMSPPFADLRTVQGALQGLAAGLDPQLTNPGDPWGRPLNYPSVWVHIAAALQLQRESHYLAFELAAIAAFLFSCHRLLRLAPSPWLLLLVFSGSTLLTVERGNNDLIVFALLVLAAFRAGAVGTAAVLGATLLKIYPVVVAPVFLRSRWQALVLVPGLALVLAVLLPEFAAIRGASPEPPAALGYGSGAVARALQRVAGQPVNRHLVGLALVAAAAALAAWRPLRLSFAAPGSDALRLRLFQVGAAVYVGSFVLAGNWDYRLVFLLPCVPHVLCLADLRLRAALLVAMLVAANALLLVRVAGTPGILLNTGAKTALFVLLAALLGDAVLAWLRARGVLPAPRNEAAA